VRPAVGPETMLAFALGANRPLLAARQCAQLPAIATLEGRSGRSAWGRRLISHLYGSHYSSPPVTGISGRSAGLQRAQRRANGPCGVLVAAAGTAQRRRPGRPPAAALLERLRWQSLGHPSRWRWRAVGLSTSGVSAWAQALCWQQIGSQIEGQIQFSLFDDESQKMRRCTNVHLLAACLICPTRTRGV